MSFDQQPDPSASRPPEWTAPGPQPGMTVPVAPVAPVAPTVKRKTRSSRVLDAALVLAGVLAIGGVAFGVGRATAPVAAADGVGTFRNGTGNAFRPNGSFDPNAAPGRGGAFALGGGLSIDGTVTAVTADTLTMKLASGQEVTFALDSSTSYHQSTAATSSAVAVGDAVSVKVKGNGRFFGGQGGGGGAAASPAPAASSAPGTAGNGQLQASDITVTH